MTAVPYTFANQSGNIPLSQLDANFATLANAVPAYADTAGIATIATTAGSAGIAATVTSNAQANITSVGTLTFLDVAGNISASYFIGNGSSLTGVVGNASTLSGTVLNSNIVTSSLTTVGNLVSLSVVGNIQANNISNLQNLTVLDTGYIYNISSTGLASLTTVTADTVSATGNISTANTVIATGNVQAGNLRTTGSVSATGNIVAGNIVAGNVETRQAQLRLAPGASEQTLSFRPNGGIGSVGIDLPNNATANTVDLTIENNIGNVRIKSAGLDGWYFYANNVLSAPGDITSTGNIAASGFVSTTGTITGGNISATGNVTGSNVSAINVVTNFISSDDSTAVTIDDDVTLIGDLDVTGGVRVFGGPLRLPSFTADQIANISAVNGDMLYNSTIDKFQGYENGVWANII